VSVFFGQNNRPEWKKRYEYKQRGNRDHSHPYFKFGVLIRNICRLSILTCLCTDLVIRSNLYELSECTINLFPSMQSKEGSCPSYC
jgi:hypothetical protein